MLARNFLLIVGLSNEILLNYMGKLEGKLKSFCKSKRVLYLNITHYMLAPCWIPNSAHYANNYASIFDAGLKKGSSTLRGCFID